MSHTINNLEIAIKYVEDHAKSCDFRLPNNTVLRMLHFLKQAETENLKIIGMGYKRFDGGDLKEININNMYEAGFMIDPESSQ